MPLGHLELTDDVQYEEQLLETSFETNVRVEATFSYPRFPETSSLKRYVNENIRRDSRSLYDAYIEKMSSLQQDAGEEEELNERTLHYGLQPVYCSPNLISLYGSKYQYAGGVHGSVHYIARTFWQNDGIVRELSLDDLFLCEYRQQLFRYCEDYFASHQWGYYSYDDHSWIGFGPEHLDAFLLTKNGLLLIFQNYVVSGFDHFPTTLLVPYALLASIAKPNGPIPSLIFSDVPR